MTQVPISRFSSSVFCFLYAALPGLANREWVPSQPIHRDLNQPTRRRKASPFLTVNKESASWLETLNAIKCHRPR